MLERRAAERNRLATFPPTVTARQNHSVLLKRSQLVRYETIGRATGHDKSWVSRFLSGSALTSLPELLAWLDQCALNLVLHDVAEDRFAPTDHERVVQLQSAISALELTRYKLRREATIDREFILALIELARVGLDALLETHSAPNSTETDSPQARPSKE